MEDNTATIIELPGGCYEDGMISLNGIRVFPMPWPAKLVGLGVGGRIITLTREEALVTAAALRSFALDG